MISMVTIMRWGINLHQLAHYLMNDASSHTTFDMRKFSQGQAAFGNSFLGYDEVTCGSIGCACGHGPNAGIPKYADETWPQYAERAFGAYEGVFDEELDRQAADLWNWVFDENWADVDNTPEGAGQRILYYLYYGVPTNALGQRYGDVPLCYTNIPKGYDHATHQYR